MQVHVTDPAPGEKRGERPESAGDRALGRVIDSSVSSHVGKSSGLRSGDCCTGGPSGPCTYLHTGAHVSCDRARRTVENLWIGGRAGGRQIGTPHFARNGAT
jgi:hypothetical protein